MEEPAAAAALLRVVDQARELNGAIDVARLERMRFIYRSWVASPHGVEGGFSLTRDELDYVLEYPQQPAHLDFLMATFRTTEHGERIDLLALLAACACLARGPLEAKAKFLFTLVDFDTEDEIVEDELAMLIALCSDGLRRLGVVVTELVDLDARAIACEAFEFVEVEDGGKMTLAQFVLWLLSHWRPAALFDRIQSLFLISTISRSLHKILQQHAHDRISSPFHMYNAAHFKEELEIEAVNVLVGPIVGPVSSSEVRILLEVDRIATVQIFAFHVDPSCRSSQRSYDQVCRVELQAGSPQVVVVDKLASGQTYQFRLLGVCKRDRERCIAVATTLRTSSSAKDQETTWQMRAINHNGIGLNTGAYRRLRDESLRAAEAKTDMVTVHFSTLRLTDWDLERMFELLRDESLSNETRVLTLLQQKFRDSLSRSELFDILRVGSNLIFSSCLDLVDPERRTMVTIMSEVDPLRANVMRIALDLWRSYIGKLWNFETDDTTATIHNGDCCILLRFDEQKVAGDGSIAQTLPTLGAVRDLVVVTRKPALCQLSTEQTSDNERLSAIDERHRVPDDVMSLVDWKRVSLDRNVYLVSYHGLAGFYSHLNIKNTAIALSVILCGPASGYARRDKLETRPMFVDFPESTVSTTVPTVVPHFVTVRRVIGESSSRPNTQVGSSRPTSRSTLRSSQGDVGLLSTRLVGEVSLLCGETGARIIAGPAIGVVSGTSAAIVLECVQDGTVDVTLNDVLTKQAVISRVSVHGNRPTKCNIKNLSPGRVYSASVVVRPNPMGDLRFHRLGSQLIGDCLIKGAQGGAIGLVQTPCRDPASMRIVLLGGDAFCGLPARDRRGYVPTVPTSLMGSIREHFVLGDSGTESIIMYDMVIHIGTIAALRHDLLRGYEMMRRDWTEVSSVTVRIEEMIRSCYRSYAAIPDVRALRSLGTNWFSGVGLLRSLVRSETPIRLLEVVRGVVHEYERCNETLEPHDSQLIHKLASQVFVIKLDTTDCLFRETHLGFVEWPERILTSRQLDAIRHVLTSKDPQLSPSDSKQVVIFCDAPFVWPFTVDSQTQSNVALDPVEDIANDPWGSYPDDLQHLLDLLFSAVATDSMLRITLVCCGVFAARVVITHTPTGRSLEQLTVGTTSNIDRESSQTARYTPESSQRVLGDDYTVTGHAVGGTTLSLKQYCVLNVVPHSQGAVCTHSFYTAGRPQASIILGPIIGRVTTRTARILIEVDRPVPSVTCILANPSSGHSVSANAELSAFAPTIFKVDGLHPGTRYKVKFEGIMTERDDIDTYVETPPLSPLTVEWLVFSHNNLRRFLSSPNDHRSDPRPSHWHRILSSGARSYQAKPASIVANSNGDSLGESLDLQSEQYNPWYHVEGFALSEPLRQTQLSVHIGGQVDLSAAFTENELVMFVAQLCDPMQSEESKNFVYSTVRFRLQEVYRNTWGVEPMRTVLGYSSNIMLLHDETDLFFSTSRIQEAVKRHSSTDEAWRVPPDNDVALVATRLRALAFELWQLYQNQLSVDVNESDLDNSRRNSSKFASHLTLGMCRLVLVNISDEMRDVCSNFEFADRAESRPKTPKTHEQVLPLALPVVKEDKQFTLLSSATWKTVDEALDISDADQRLETQSGSRAKAKKADVSIKQLVVFLPVDLIDIVEKVPAVRSEIVHLLEKLFKWKLGARTDRNVLLVCSSERSASMSFKVTDEKVNESLVLTRVSSISELKDPQMAKTAHTKSKPKSVAGVSKAAAMMKGYFSKRFTYQSTPLPSGSTSPCTVGTLCRSYARYMFLSDYRRGFLNESLLYFPSRSLPKILVGPIVGRIVRVEREAPVSDASEDMESAVSFSVPILIEANSPARLTCVVVDSMANTETRTVLEIQGDEPSVFCVHGLAPLRRYVYFFEGVSNGESRRGCFHTPPAETNSLNLVAISSNFPTHMDEEQDSLWAPLLERAKLPWCGLDAILHLGGQVPLHEAAIECVEWASRELSREILHGNPCDVDKKRVEHVRTRARRRFQEEYHICWNLPNIRELLAHCSQWFLQSKADIAPFYGRECPGPVEASRAASLVVSVAKEVVRAYQIQLITAVEGARPLEKPVLQSAVELHQQDAKPIRDTSSPSTVEPATMSAVIPEPTLSQPNEGGAVSVVNVQDVNADDTGESGADEIVASGGAVYWQHEDIAVFMGDMRSVSTAYDLGETEPITCNARLSRPLSLQENPMMSEQQWKCFENVLRKKRTQLLVLCMELPLIVTNTEHVEKLRDELRSGQAHQVPWKLYDHNHILQHWVACKRQLEQLLLLLFKWKAKRSGRDVLILSGGMRIGIDTMIQDRETKLSIRNLTVGPVTANVETFEFPLSGIACATFGGGIKDDHFTFRHSLLAKNNYLLLRLSVEQPVDEGAMQGKSKMSDSKSSNVAADFVPNEPAVLLRLHPVDKFQRFPLWWTTYVPMGKAVFWDDTITLKSETDERVLVLRDYVWHDRGFSGALEVFYEKYQFAETARMEDLRSRHSQHVDLRASFMGVLGDLWRAIPESKRQQMAYFLDPFVLEILMSHVAPDLFSNRLTSGEPIELAFFSRVIREFVFAACLLRLTIITLQEDEAKERQAAIEKRKRDAELAAQEKERAEQAAQHEEARMDELLRTDPLQYAKIKLAAEEAEKQEKLARHQEKLERKKAERLAELEEEQAIAKEQKKLNKLAERDVVEYERRQQALDARVRKLEEKRAQRAAQKKAAAEKVQQEQASTEL